MASVSGFSIVGGDGSVLIDGQTVTCRQIMSGTIIGGVDSAFQFNAKAAEEIRSYALYAHTARLFVMFTKYNIVKIRGGDVRMDRWHLMMPEVGCIRDGSGGALPLTTHLTLTYPDISKYPSECCYCIGGDFICCLMSDDRH